MNTTIKSDLYEFSVRHREFIRQRIDAPDTMDKARVARERLVRIGIIDNEGNLTKHYRSE